MNYDAEIERIRREMQQRAIALCANDAKYQNLAGQIMIIQKLKAEEVEE